MKIIFFNDKKNYNERYRGGLMYEFSQSGYDVLNLALEDFHWLKIWRLALFYKRTFNSIVVSSNLRANIFILISFWLKGVVIINGLGRVRRNRLFRNFLIFLIWINKDNKSFIIQNYADYRFFKKLFKSIFWIPGSGGTKRKSSSDEFFIVSRPGKLPLQINALEHFCKEVVVKKVNVIGLDRLEGSDIPEINRTGLNFCGFVEQRDLFRHGGKFVQLPGYGEGIPHSLVDALCSDVDVYMSRSQYIQFGLYKFNKDYETLNNAFIRLSRDLKWNEALGEVNIIQQYVTYINREIMRD